MASADKQKKDRIDSFINDSLKAVLSDLEQDEMPDQLTDLLSALRAQDDELKSEK